MLGSREDLGVICIIAGILQGIAGLLNLVGVVSGNGALFLIPMGVYNLVLGSTFLGAAKMLKSVVTTEGNDIVLMMSAIQHLSKAFRIQIIATVVATILVIGFFFVGMMAISAMLSG